MSCFSFAVYLVVMSESKEEESDHSTQPVSTRQEFQQTIGNFVSNSTIHGISHMNGSKHPFLRFMWCLLFLFNLGYLVYYLSDNVKKMQAYDTVVSTRLDYNKSPIPFPAVTFCNINTIRESKRKNHHHANIIKYYNLTVSIYIQYTEPTRFPQIGEQMFQTITY